MQKTIQYVMCGAGRLVVLAVVTGVVALVGSASAFADPVWRLTSLANSTVAAGGTLQYHLELYNLGDTMAVGDGEHPVIVTATLPPGLTGKQVLLNQPAYLPEPQPASVLGWECTAGDGVSPVEGASTIKCVDPSTEIVPRGLQRRGHLTVEVAVAAGASGVLSSSFALEGGGASNTSATVDPTRITAAMPAFGLDAFDGQVSDVAGNAFSQAGGHPYETSTSIDFNTRPNAAPMKQYAWPVEPVKDVLVDLPPGFVGDPAGVAQCTASQLANMYTTLVEGPLCPPASQVGTVLVRAGTLGLVQEAYGPLPLFNMVPPPGAPARFAFNVLGNLVTLDARVRGGSDFGVSVDSRNTSEGLDVAGSTVTLWGVPADPSHDAERACPGRPGPAAPVGETVSCTSGAPLAAFLRNPTSCTAPGEGLRWGVHLNSWTNPGSFNADGTPDLSDPAWQEGSFRTHASPSYPAPLSEWGAQVGTTGCEGVPFTPDMKVIPTSSAPASPSGLDVTVSVPQEALSVPGAIAQADLKRIVVRLPEGVTLNPAAAGGLGACTPAEIDLKSAGSASCPDASKVGTVEIHTPLLEDPLQGGVYLASQGDNPFGSLLAVYLVAEGHGVVIKVPAKVDADPVTGRLTATFDNLPQQPADTINVNMFAGARAPLNTPSVCGVSNGQSTLEGWNAKSVSIAQPYSVDCTPGLGGFSPSFTAGTLNPQAGSFSPFVLSFSRHDGEQALRGVQQTLAPGLSAKLAGVPLCSDGDAQAGTCPASSQIGTVTVGAGVGPDPFFLGGKIFLTGGYNGGPFGEVVVVRVLAGPFDLGTVVVRGSIRIDPHTAQATVVSDPFPTILQGIPVALRRVDVSLDRPGFTFNPTNCSPLSIAGTLSSAQGASANVSSHFQAANCATLPFKPTFKVATGAKTSKKGGASLDVRVTSGAGQANLGKVAVSLPKQLPSRLTTIQQACTAAVFAANPASCPAGSNIGIATASTPVLANPVTGPAYLVSHGGAAFPDLVMVLQGEGVTTQIVGSINIKKGVTSSAFDSIPDIPISTFELSLPQGPHSALGSNLPAKAKGNLCGQSLTMPTTLTGQNGAQVKQSTKIAVSGCPKAKKAKKHTRRAHGNAVKKKPKQKGGKK